MASDKHLNWSLQRVLSFYFKSCVNRTGILQPFSIMIYLSTHLEFPGLEKSSSHDQWLLVRNPKARKNHENRTEVGGAGRAKKNRRQVEKSMQEKICPNWWLKRKEGVEKCNHRWKEIWKENKIGYLNHLKMYRVSYSPIKEVRNKWRYDFKKAHGNL